jgi:hypothetical protein
LTVVLYRHGTWSLTLSEKHRQRVFENRVLRSFLGPKREEVMGGWRKVDNGYLHDFYSVPNIILVMKSRRMM